MYLGAARFNLPIRRKNRYQHLIYYLIHFTMQNLHLLEILAEAFRYHVHRFQCSAVPVELAAMKFVFWFVVFGIAEFLMLLACVIV
jgi:hypothetical protein